MISIELRFQIEPAELGIYSMGNPDTPNILFYEASEGSLGVLSALVDDPKAFREVIEVAIQVCDFQNKGKGKASYDDLLSYQVVYPVLPMDILGLYILLPA